MNLILHFLLNYLVVDAVFGNAEKYLFYIFIFSLIVDLDHVPFFFKKKNKIFSKTGSKARSKFHELYGLTFFSIAISLFSIFVDKMIIKVIALSLILHLASDFFVGKTRPFYPYSKKEVFLNIIPVKYRVRFEIFATIILGAVLWLSIRS